MNNVTSPKENADAGEVRYTYIVGNTFGLKKITYTAVDGLAVFEDDIVLGTVEQMERIRDAVEHPDPDIEAAAAIVGAQFRWTDEIIPFEVDANMPDQQRVTDAINHIEANTTLSLVPRTHQARWIRFEGGNGCSSEVGMRGSPQVITLGAGCDWPRAVHEICHAAGLWHEQSREDRDRFVVIHWDNIAENRRHNFNQHITDGDDIGPYDYDSLMHYERRAFAIDPGRDTITPTPDANRAIGQRNGLSTGDIVALNSLYPPRKAILGDTSSNGPALAARNGEVLLGWTGTGNLWLNFMCSNDGLNFANKVTLDDISPNALALTVFNGNYIVAWTGVGNNWLNIMQSADGMNWGNKVTLDDSSLSTPSLSVLGNRLFLVWRGVGNNWLNIMQSTDGRNWGNKVTLEDTTTSGPTLATLGNRLLLGWRGVGNDWLNILQSTDGMSFHNKVTLGETTVSKPQLFVRGNRAFLTWQGVGNRFLNILSSPDGWIWENKFVSRETSIDGPVLSAIGNNLVWCWTGTDAAHSLNTLLFNWA